MFPTQAMGALFVTVQACASTRAFQNPTPIWNPRKSIRKHATTSLPAVARQSSPLEDLWTQTKERIPTFQKPTPVGKFFKAWNAGNVDEAVAQFDPDCTFEDATYSSTFQGARELKRHLLLVQNSYDAPLQYVVDDMALSRKGDKAGVKYHLEKNGETIPNSRHNSFFVIDVESNRIESCFDIVEPARKTGTLDLTVLRLASNVMDSTTKSNKIDMTPDMLEAKEPPRELDLPQSMEQTPSKLLGGDDKPQRTTTAPEQYFEAWNRRDMDAAVDVFTNDCIYEDTVFPEPFTGQPALKQHLSICADSFPSKFRFVVDDMANGGDSIAVRWHVENKGEQLPFTRGCSFYRIDARTGKIQEGFDEIEPAVFKLGGFTLWLSSLKTKIATEPERLVPLVIWVAYMYIVFVSDGILPGANALQLERRTWEEVRDLSLNFFLVSPLLNLPFSPSVHPILEGVFNLLLSWAALFAGFFSDEREDKPNLVPIIPAVVGMQFLTSAFYLPYLGFRTTENDDQVMSEDLGKAARVVENRLLGPFLGTVGAGSIIWGILGRQPDFGDWSERVSSFWSLMSIDRVGSSFLVDLTIFAVFQGWLVDDDLRRRGVDCQGGEGNILRNIAKFVPFFGLAAYMTLRPQYRSREDVN